MKLWSDQLKAFYSSLRPKVQLPEHFEWLTPYQNGEVLRILNVFTEMFYNDANKRVLLLGINPGRYGAGVTGINFTAPRQLHTVLKIHSTLGNQSELSAEFVYEVIEAFGGAKKFYANFFMSSVCPLGLLYKSKNINYYDDRHLLQAVESFIVATMKKQMRFNVCRKTVICIGGDKNYKYLAPLNSRLSLFEKIVCLPHPRFIMQYRRKIKHEFVQQYVDLLQLLAPEA